MNCVSCDTYMRVSALVCFCFFSGVFFTARVAGACPVTTKKITAVVALGCTDKSSTAKSKKIPA